jgi:hypothetical protein
MDPIQIGYENVDWIHLDRDRSLDLTFENHLLLETSSADIVSLVL